MNNERIEVKGNREVEAKKDSVEGEAKSTVRNVSVSTGLRAGYMYGHLLSPNEL